MAGEARANPYPGHRAAIGPMHSDAAEVGGRPHGVVTWDELWGPFCVNLQRRPLRRDIAFIGSSQLRLIFLSRSPIFIEFL